MQKHVNQQCMPRLLERIRRVVNSSRVISGVHTASASASAYSNCSNGFSSLPVTNSYNEYLGIKGTALAGEEEGWPEFPTLVAGGEVNMLGCWEFSPWGPNMYA